MKTAIRYPQQATGVALERVNAGGILVDSSARRHQLNATAVALWELCDGITSTEEMVEAITMLFTESPANIRRDVAVTLDRFTEEGLVVWN